MSIAAYKRTISDTETPRQIERRVLAQVTADLERKCSEFDNSKQRIDRLQCLADGLRYDVWKNEKIWLTFKADLADAGNSMNPTLKASLLSIAIWVERHSQGVMAGAKDILPLVEVNRSIIQGLDGKAFSTAE